MNNFLILETKSEKDYELLDSGDGEKLERYGKIILSRPDPQALWKKNLSESKWKTANITFLRSTSNSGWKILNQPVPKDWVVKLGDLSFLVKPTTFKHVGVFPEQVSNWKWIKGVIERSNKKVSVLNLFGYTGGATIAALKSGASVCHVDGSRVAIDWARKNAALSDVADKPVRWILDDARAFLKKEIRRGKKYDGIVMDPPAFGHGPDGELWKIEKHLLDLFSLCKSVLSDEPVFVLVNGYASGYSAIAYKNNIDDMMQKYKGSVEIGELTIRESFDDRLLPCGIFTRWTNG